MIHHPRTGCRPIVLLAAYAAACSGGSVTGSRPPAQAPPPDTCGLVAIDMVEEPALAHTDPDTSVLVIRYRPFSEGVQESPLTLRVLVQRSREEALRSDLAHRSVVVCRPSRSATRPPHFR